MGSREFRRGVRRPRFMKQVPAGSRQIKSQLLPRTLLVQKLSFFAFSSASIFNTVPDSCPTVLDLRYSETCSSRSTHLSELRSDWLPTPTPFLRTPPGRLTRVITIPDHVQIQAPEEARAGVPCTPASDRSIMANCLNTCAMMHDKKERRAQHGKHGLHVQKA